MVEKVRACKNCLSVVDWRNIFTCCGLMFGSVHFQSQQAVKQARAMLEFAEGTFHVPRDLIGEITNTELHGSLSHLWAVLL